MQELQAAITAATDADAGHHDVDELASDLDVEPEDVIEALSARGCFRSESTDRQVGTSGLTIGETLAYTDADLELVDEWVTFCRLSRELTADERELLRMRFVEDLTQQEIADRLGVSQMQVSRRLRKVLDAMRRQSRTRPGTMPPRGGVAVLAPKPRGALSDVLFEAMRNPAASWDDVIRHPARSRGRRPDRPLGALRAALPRVRRRRRRPRVAARAPAGAA